MEGFNPVPLSLALALLSLAASAVFANVGLVGNNVSVSFDDMEATFGPAVRMSGECGVLRLSEPIDACSPLTNKVALTRAKHVCASPFVLIVRGGCSFEDKVTRAQSAGFKAAVVYDDKDDGVLISMAGNSAGIKIHAVFVSKAAGETFMKYADLANMEFWIYPSFENSAWSIMAISFISLLVISAVLATCFFVRRHRIRRGRSRASRVKEFHGMSSKLVDAMPSLIFTSVSEGNCTSSTCAICLEDYDVGERLRILPCRHQFHIICVDSWLTSWRTFCPVCKRDAKANMAGPPASECTPLLSSSPASVASSPVLSRYLDIHSTQAMSRSPSDSHIHVLSRSPYVQQPNWAHRHSPSLSASQSSVDLRMASSQQSQWAYRCSPANASFQRSHSSYVSTQHSLGYPAASPNARYNSVYIPSPSDASASYVGSSSQQLLPLRCSESAAGFPLFASAQSLPGC